MNQTRAYELVVAHLRSRPSEVIAWRLLANLMDARRIPSRSSRSPISIQFLYLLWGSSTLDREKDLFPSVRNPTNEGFVRFTFLYHYHLSHATYCPISSRIILSPSAKPPSQIIQPHRDTTYLVYAASIIPTQAPNPGTNRIRPGTISGSSPQGGKWLLEFQ